MRLNASRPGLNVGIVGCGEVADAYAEDIDSYPELHLDGVFDLVPARADAIASRFRCRAYESLEALLAEDGIDIVLNLTPFQAHKQVTQACLLAGKHVYSEKPLALTFDEVRALIELAERRVLLLACAPCPLLGEAQHTAGSIIRQGQLGTIRLVTAEAHGGRIESWHPSPESFYDVGPLWDIAVYPLTLVTALLGPARRVFAAGKKLGLSRQTLDSRPITVRSSDLIVAAIELEGGPLLRLTTTFYLPRHGPGRAGVEFHGDDGSLYLEDWQLLDAGVELLLREMDPRAVPLVRQPERSIEYGRGLRDLASAVIDGRRPAASSDQAAHVVEIVQALTRSIELEIPVPIHSGFSAPPASTGPPSNIGLDSHRPPNIATRG